MRNNYRAAINRITAARDGQVRLNRVHSRKATIWARADGAVVLDRDGASSRVLRLSRADSFDDTGESKGDLSVQ